MPIYDISGNAIALDESHLTVKRNDETLVNQFLTVAQSYLNQTDIVYSDGNTIFYTTGATNGIDCSTFVGLCLMGYSYQESPYYTHQYKQYDAWEANSEYNWTVATMRYQISRYIDGHNPTERMRLACQLARWMMERNQVVPVSDGFRDVMPGDIVFWASKSRSTGEWSHPDWFMHISHVGIVLDKELAPDTYNYIDINGRTHSGTWDKIKYPFKHQIIEVTTVTPPCTNYRYLEMGQDDSTEVYFSNVNTVALICRPDLGALSESAI